MLRDAALNTSDVLGEDARDFDLLINLNPTLTIDDDDTVVKAAEERLACGVVQRNLEEMSVRRDEAYYELFGDTAPGAIANEESLVKLPRPPSRLHHGHARARRAAPRPSCTGRLRSAPGVRLLTSSARDWLLTPVCVSAWLR